MGLAMNREQIKNKEMAKVLDCCYLHRIRLLSRTLTKIYDDALKPINLKVTQMNLMGVVTKLGPITPQDMSEKLGMEKSTLSRNIDRLIMNGWIEHVAGKNNRSHQLKITGKGRTIMKNALKYWRQAQKRAEKILGSEGSLAVMTAGNLLWRE